MSHSTGGSAGFGINHNTIAKGPQVTDRLKLLKSNSKYKQVNSSASAEKRKDIMHDRYDD
jgi:hypothetical protein